MGERLEQLDQMQRSSLDEAFRLLDPSGSGLLRREDLMLVFEELNHYKEIAYISDARARLVSYAGSAHSRSRHARPLRSRHGRFKGSRTLPPPLIPAARRKVVIALADITSLLLLMAALRGSRLVWR